MAANRKGRSKSLGRGGNGRQLEEALVGEELLEESVGSENTTSTHLGYRSRFGVYKAARHLYSSTDTDEDEMKPSTSFRRNTVHLNKSDKGSASDVGPSGSRETVLHKHFDELGVAHNISKLCIPSSKSDTDEVAHRSGRGTWKYSLTSSVTSNPFSARTLKSNDDNFRNTNVAGNEHYESGGSSIRFLSSYNSEIIPNIQTALCPLLKVEPSSSLSDVASGLGPLKFDLLSRIQQIARNRNMATIEIRIGDNVQLCHLLILQCMSPLFQEHKANQNFVFPEDKVSAAAFEFAYDCYLNEKFYIKPEIFCELLKTTRFVRIGELEQLCWMHVDNITNFNENTAFELYAKIKDDVDLLTLRQLMQSRIQFYFLPMVAKKFFLDLSVDDVVSFFNLGTIAINNEMDLFLIAVYWVYHNFEERKAYIEKLMVPIQFEEMPTMFLVYMSQGPGCKYLQQFSEHAQLSARFNQALQNWWLMKYDQNADNAIIPRRRVLIKDQNGTYLACVDDPSKMDLVYTEFLEYLKIITTGGEKYWHTLKST